MISRHTSRKLLDAGKQAFTWPNEVSKSITQLEPESLLALLYTLLLLHTLVLLRQLPCRIDISIRKVYGSVYRPQR